MEPVLIIFACICLVAISVVCVIGANVLLDLKRQFARIVVVAESVSRDVSDLKTQLNPVVMEAHQVLQRASSTLETADIELGKLGKGADTFAAIADDVRTLERMIVNRLQGPLTDISEVVAGTAKGLSTFVRRLVQR